LNEFKSFTDLPREPEKPVKPIPNRQNIKIYEERGTGRVIDDSRLEINWKPIDKVAARVVAKAQWYEMPPNVRKTEKTETDQAEKRQPETRKAISHSRQRADLSKVEQATSSNDKTMREEQPTKARLSTKRMLMPDSGRVEEVFNVKEANVVATDLKTKEMKAHVENTETLVQRAQDAADAMEFLLQNIQKPHAEYTEWIKTQLDGIRQSRMALENETRLMMLQFKEVRKFFLEETYEEEIARAYRFLNLCKEFKKLQDDGTLELLSDTILKLACK
jgi:hypothetical protein